MLLVFKNSRRIKPLRLLRYLTVCSKLPCTRSNTVSHFVKRKLALKVCNFDTVAEPNDTEMAMEERVGMSASHAQSRNTKLL